MTNTRVTTHVMTSIVLLNYSDLWSALRGTSGFWSLRRNDRQRGSCALLGYHTASYRDSLLTFRYRQFWPLKVMRKKLISAIVWSLVHTWPLPQIYRQIDSHLPWEFSSRQWTHPNAAQSKRSWIGNTLHNTVLKYLTSSCLDARSLEANLSTQSFYP
jgi:hypothetical protein